MRPLPSYEEATSVAKPTTAATAATAAVDTDAVAIVAPTTVRGDDPQRAASDALDVDVEAPRARTAT